MVGSLHNSGAFPSEITKDINNDTFAFRAWKDQASYPSADFVAQKVELEGRILKVIPKRKGVVILADGHPADEHPFYDSKSGKVDYSFRFAILFEGYLDPGMLQTGNRIVVIGVTDKPSPEAIGWMSEVLPHLLARCLHIWKAEYPQEERTFCREKA
jgi:starvation-inducible outer membrane lipoprotein